MPGCVLHVSGDDFRVDAFLADSNLRPYRVHHRGDIGRRSRRFTDSGLSLDISFADGDLEAEITDAIRFLSTHEAELQRLHDFPGVTDMRLDFGYDCRNVAVQCDYLPPDLLTRAGTLGIRSHRRLRASPDYDELLLLAQCDRQGRQIGVLVPDVDEALEYVEDLATSCGDEG